MNLASLHLIDQFPIRLDGPSSKINLFIYFTKTFIYKYKSFDAGRVCTLTFKLTF